LTEFGEYAADLITDEQRAAMFAAQANAEELVRLLEPQEFGVRLIQRCLVH
jgi:hypothetical protein